MKFLLLLVLFVIAISDVLTFRLLEKAVRPVGPINEKCIHTEGCEFFECFEKRFPCGRDYWMMKWGLKYCAKYANPAIYNSFTADGRNMLNFTMACQKKFVEKQYRSERPMRCKRFYEQAFEGQGKCYAEMGDTFCKVFPKNKNQFMKTMDRDDYMNSYFMTMVKNTLGKCSPPIDLFVLMFS